MNHRTIAQTVLDVLRPRILRGDLAPGARLKEVELARDLGVSPTPVRDAIQRLADEGLVEIIPHRGASVREFTLQDAVEMTELREALEVIAFRKAAPRITEERLAELRELHQVHHDACVAGDYDAAVQADMEFHDYVVQLASNRRLVDMLRKLSVQTAYFRTDRYYVDRAEVANWRDHHLPLLEALASRDAEVAEEAIRTHVAHKHELFVRRLQEVAEWPASSKALGEAAG